MTREELEAAVKAAKEKIKANKNGEADMMTMFADFQLKISNDIMGVFRRNMELIRTSYRVDSAETAAGYWAVHCTAASTGLLAATFFDACIKTKIKFPGYETLEIKASPAMITPEALAWVTGHMLMQILNIIHNLEVEPAAGGECSKQLAEHIRPMLETMLEAKTNPVRN